MNELPIAIAREHVSNARARRPGRVLLHEVEQLPPLDRLALEVPREIHAGVIAVRSPEAGDGGGVAV